MRLKNTLRRGVAAAVIAGVVVTSGLPVYAKTWDISEGSITVEADGEEDGKSYNKVTQGDKETVRDTDTVITGKSESNTVTIKSGGGGASPRRDPQGRQHQVGQRRRPQGRGRRQRAAGAGRKQ